MKRRRGFTLVECVIASLVILIILGALAMAVKFFVEGSRRIELRKNILMVASAEVSTYEQAGYPETGETTRFETLGRSDFTVYSTVTQLTPSVRELVVSVSGTSGSETASLELVRHFHE